MMVLTRVSDTYRVDKFLLREHTRLYGELRYDVKIKLTILFN